MAERGRKDPRGRGSGGGHAARGLDFRPRNRARRSGRSFGHARPAAPQPRHYQGLPPTDPFVCMPPPRRRLSQWR
ncbi:hypothetical protein ACRRTK_016416 [Alexandromys fortis]